MSEQQTHGAELVPAPPKEMDYSQREQQSYFRGVAPSDPINKMMGVAVALKDAVFITDAARGNASSVFFLLSMAQEMGLAWTHGLRSIYLTKGGKPGLQGDVVLALLLSKGFKVKFTKSTKDEASCWIKRPGEDGMEFEDSFTIDDAKTAKLAGKDNWQMYPKDLLRWRALMRTARIVAADVIGGIYLPEELESLEPQYFTSPSRQEAEAEADRQAEEDPALAITPKVKPQPETVETKTVDSDPWVERSESFLKEQVRKKQADNPVCEICGETECEHLPDPGSKPKLRATKSKAQAKKTDEPPANTDAEIQAARAQLKARIGSIASRVEGADAKMIFDFVVGYHGDTEAAKDMQKVSSALDALELALKDKTQDGVSLTIDAAAFGKYVARSPKRAPEDNNRFSSVFPNWNRETADFAEHAMKSRHMTVDKFTTILKSFGFQEYNDADAQAGLLLYAHSPNATLVLKHAKKEKGLLPTAILKIVEERLGAPLTLKTAHDAADKAITAAWNEVQSS